jgi:sugar-specific transcriptional regulator TrmB
MLATTSATGYDGNQGINPSPTDEIFRKQVKELIDSAQKEILVIAAELGSYRFPDLKWAMNRAIERAVKIRIYASHPNQATINGLLAQGCEIHIGKEIKDHSLITDSESFVHSKPHRQSLESEKERHT